jgi:hypothetical protein
MRLNYIYLVRLILLISLILVTGCQSGGRRAPGTIDDAETREIVDRIEAMKQVHHLCPSPAEMLSVIDVADLSFDGDLLNPVENADQYLGTRSATLALGVYITDMAYSALFGRHEETLDYLEVVRSVAEQIRLTGAINDELIQKARDNVEYLDSLFTISNEAFINMLFFCERNDRPNTIVILSAGAFIESLYLAVNLVDDYDEAGYILQHLTDQKYALENLMAFAETLHEEDENITAVIEDMKPLIEIYEGIETGSGEVTITSESEADEEQPKKIVIGGSETKPSVLSAAEFEKLREEAIQLRTRLIEG